MGSLSRRGQRKEIRLRDLLFVRAGAVGTASDPWKLIANFDKASGITPVEGRRGHIVLSLPELATFLSAVPVSAIESDADMQALVRTAAMLRREGKAASDEG